MHMPFCTADEGCDKCDLYRKDRVISAARDLLDAHRQRSTWSGSYNMWRLMARDRLMRLDAAMVDLVQDRREQE